MDRFLQSLVVFPIIFRVLYIQTVVGLGISEPSPVCQAIFPSSGCLEIPMKKKTAKLPGMLEADEAGIEALSYSSLRQVELNLRAATLGVGNFCSV